MFELEIDNVWVEDARGDLWVVTGRIPNDDDDTLLAIQTGDEAMARGVFRAYMTASRSRAVMEFDRLHFGTDLIITAVIRVAVYKPKAITEVITQ